MSPVFLLFAIIAGFIVVPSIIKAKRSANAQATKEDAERTISPSSDLAEKPTDLTERRQPIQATVSASVIAPRTSKTDCPCPKPSVPRGSMAHFEFEPEGKGTHPKKHPRQELTPSLKDPVHTDGTTVTAAELYLTQNELTKAVLYSEILGKPKALLP